MRKLFFLFAALTLSAGMWAIDGVKYIDADGVEQIANNLTTVQSNSITTLTEGWYIVISSNVQQGTLVCLGAVHLIIVDGAKLTAKGEDDQPGIKVSGEGNSLTIYGQSAQTGQLIANGGQKAAGIGGGIYGSGSNITINGGIVTATGGDGGAGIGGGQEASCSNITINGGTVTATGSYGAGIGGGNHGSGSNITINGGMVTANGGAHAAAGIGGGNFGSGSNITINGGMVTANGGSLAACIGSGFSGSAASNIFVTTTHIVKAGDAANPTEVIAPNRTATTDIASDLAGNRYVTVQLDLTPYKTAAIAEIDAAIEGVTDEYITAIAADAKTNITNAETTAAINSVKTLAMAKINAIKEIIAATKDLTLFSAEESYIDAIKSSIQQDDDVNLINGDKQLGLDYIALHDAKLAAVAAVRQDMGDYAESEAIYNFIGGPAIEGAVDADKVTEAKNAAIAKLEEFSEVLGEASIAGYNKGKEDGIEEALGEMGEPCEDCPAIEVSDGTTTVTLYNPKNVKFKKIQKEQ